MLLPRNINVILFNTITNVRDSHIVPIMTEITRKDVNYVISNVVLKIGQNILLILPFAGIEANYLASKMACRFLIIVVC